ncbi:MAG: hypothetical protein WC868_01245 [Bacteroidales bacterium]
MNGAHLHLILSHITIVGAGFTMLLLIFALVQNSKELKRTALWFAVITGITSLAAYFTGDSAIYCHSAGSKNRTDRWKNKAY